MKDEKLLNLSTQPPKGITFRSFTMITKEQVKEARTSLKEMYLRYIKENFGIEVGVIVICRDTYSKKDGCECLVTQIEIDLNYLPTDSPTFYVTPRSKNGEWSKLKKKFYQQNEWELKS